MSAERTISPIDGLVPGCRRYLRLGGSLDFARFCTDKLHGLTFDQTLGFYNRFRALEPSLEDIAILGLCDRFFLLSGILNRKDILHPWLFKRCREVEASPDDMLDLWAREHYKDLDSDNIVATSKGWKKHGDLEVGDKVFSLDGSQTPIVACTPHWDRRPSYRITFTDGSSVVSGQSHLWLVLEHCRRRRDYARTDRWPFIRSTRYLAEQDHEKLECTGDRRIQIPISERLEQPASRSDEVFHVRREQERTKPGTRWGHCYIESVDPVGYRTTNCIQVAHPSGLYLVGEDLIPTHNSTIITYAGSIQEIVRDPEITIGIFSHIRPKAVDFLRQIKREFEDNRLLKRLYFDVLFEDPKKAAPKWSENDGLIVRRQSNPHDPTLSAHGLVDGMPTGSHFHLRIYDDVVTEKTVSTPEMVKKVTLMRELSDHLGTRDGRQWNIGTRYHMADTYQVQLDRAELKPRIYPATDNGEIDGNPVFLTPEQWEAKKNRPLTVAAQMLQNPAAGVGAMFNVRWLRPYQVRPVSLNVYILVDPSKGANKTQRSDRTAMAVIGVDAADNRFLLDGFRHRMDLEERFEKLKMLHKKWSAAHGILSVSVGYERYGMQADIEAFDVMMRLGKYSFAIDEVAWPREGGPSKEDRVQRLVPDIKQGRFYIPRRLYHESVGESRWSVNTETGQIHYEPVTGDSKLERKMVETKQAWRRIGPIKRVQEDHTVYDLTRAFIEEYIFFPFGAKDDLIDAVSRIYDMDPAAPARYPRDLLDPAVYPDT